MRQVLQALAIEQAARGDVANEESVVVTVELSTGTKVTGLLQGTDDDDTFGILRFLSDEGVYADIPRHYRIGAVVAAYYMEGS